MAVTSAPHAMPPQLLWDPTRRVHISRWHYKKRECPNIFSNSVVLESCFAVNTLYIHSFLTAAFHVVDFEILLCTVWNTWIGFSIFFHKRES